MRCAILDLGSNTFHLLIVELKADRSIKEIYRQRQYVKLAEKGIDKIGKDAYLRALVCLKEFKQYLEEYQVENIRVFGTATIRSSENGAQFSKEVKQKFNLDIECISGEEEAHLIALGVIEATNLNEDTHLIMDIGGGSVEFIIIDKNKMVWSRSFNIGISILKRAYHVTDPMTKEDKNEMRNFLHKELSPLKKALSQYAQIQSLVGASGSFEVLIKVLDLKKNKPAYFKTDRSKFNLFKNKIEHLNFQERINHPHIPDPRADLIVVALILIDLVLNICNAEQLIISEYALKEGALSSMHLDI